MTLDFWGGTHGDKRSVLGSSQEQRLPFNPQSLVIEIQQDGTTSQGMISLRARNCWHSFSHYLLSWRTENTLSVNCLLSIQSGFSGKWVLDNQPFKGSKELATPFFWAFFPPEVQIPVLLVITSVKLPFTHFLPEPEVPLPPRGDRRPPTVQEFIFSN